MSLLRKKLNRSKRPSRYRRPTALRLEGLEDRRVMAALGGVPFSRAVAPPIVAPPVAPAPADDAGGTIAEAREVDLPAFVQRSMDDHLPSAADVDVYSFELQEGDLLVADVDRIASGVSPRSRMSVLDENGNVVTSYAGWSTEPESGRSTPDPSLKFWAEEAGTYYLQLETTASTYDASRAYKLNLERVALDDRDPQAPRLDAAGEFHAWLNEAGDRLNVTGPSGYGFSLEADWQTTRSGGRTSLSGKGTIPSPSPGEIAEATTTYSAAGTILVHTPALDGSIGSIALQVPAGEQFMVTTVTPGWDELGTIQEIEGELGFSLAPLADQIGGALGWAISDVAIAPKWTIRMGSEVESAYPQHDVEQVLQGVPYFVYGDTGSIVAELGKAQIVSGNSGDLILVADPADPFLYVGYKDYAIAGSLNGLIPFNNNVGPQTWSFPERGFGPEQFYGHVYVSAEHELELDGLPIPISLSGGVTLNLDADGDGEFLGGVLNADQLLKGGFNEAVPDAQAIQAGPLVRSQGTIGTASPTLMRNVDALDDAFRDVGANGSSPSLSGRVGSLTCAKLSVTGNVNPGTPEEDCWNVNGDRQEADNGVASRTLATNVEAVDSALESIDSSGGGLSTVESEVTVPSVEGNVGALQAVFDDIHVGINGEVHVALALGNYSVAVPVGEAEALYSGTDHAVWFRGAQGYALDPWEGTPLDYLTGGPGMEVEGYVYADGPYSVSITGSQHLFGRDAELTVAVTSDGTAAGTEISANGTVELPIGRATVGGTIELDGDLDLYGSACVDIGGRDNYIRGCAAVTLTKSGSEMSVAADLDASGQFLIRAAGKEVAKAKGQVNGSLKFTVDFEGQTRIDAADLHYDVDVYLLGKKVGSAKGGFELDGNELSFRAFGKRFTLELPV